VIAMFASNHARRSVLDKSEPLLLGSPAGPEDARRVRNETAT
jgi:hypothetical protein